MILLVRSLWLAEMRKNDKGRKRRSLRKTPLCLCCWEQVLKLGVVNACTVLESNFSFA